MSASSSPAKVWIKTKIFFLEGVLRPLRPMEMLRFGSYYGGWWIPCINPSLGPAFCVGAGFDVTFDLELQRLGYRVYTVDPTPASIEYVKANAPTLNLVPLGVAKYSGEANFVADSTWRGSWAIGGNATGSSGFVMPVVTVSDLVASVGEQHIGILKLDIEGAEHDVLSTISNIATRPPCICVEFDDRNLYRVLKSVRLMKRLGYVLLQIENWNFTFVTKDSIGTSSVDLQ